jgi:multidrug efflux pump subunit AcrB
MKSVIQFFINRSFVVNMISAFIILAGLILGSMIKRDVIPPFEFKSIDVSLSLPGASATEIEKYLAYPIEMALQGLPHSTEVTTTSQSGKFEARVYFNADHKQMGESVEQVRARINAISWQLPQEVRDIRVDQNKVTSVFHMGIAMEGLDETINKDRLTAKRLADKMKALPGILDATIQMNNQNLYIKINTQKIARYEISIAEIRERIQQALNFSPIGQVDFDEKLFSIEVKRPAEAIDSLKKLALRGNRTGDIIYLEELADISLEIDEIKEHHRFNGKPAINIYTRKDISSDAIGLKKQIEQILIETNQALPEGQRAVIFLDAPRFIQMQLDTLTYNGMFGLILVLIILTLFFNWKVALATSFGIPIAYCGTLIALYMFNISIDIISVVGMILVLGILVDDAIIVAERYIENLEKGLKPKEAALEASRDLMLPVTGTILTTIFAFAPMVLVASEIAVVFYAVPVVIITSLIMSWLESFFILPNHMQHFIRNIHHKTGESGLFNGTKRIYITVLHWVLRFRYIAIVCLIVFFAFSGWIAKNKIQQSFRFNPSSERISAKITLKENKSLEFTEKAIKPIEDYLLALPKDKFKNMDSSIGQMWTRGRNYTGYRYARFNLHINDEISHPQALKKEYSKKIQEELQAFKTEDFEEIRVSREMNDQEEEKKDMVSIELSGHEDVDYLDLKNTIKEQIKDNDLKLELVKEVNEFDEKWIFTPDTRRLAQHQMTLGSITSQLRSFFVPHELMQIRLLGETKWIYTQVQRGKVLTKSELNQMTVINNLGLSVPLSTLGTWEKKQQLATIRHKDGRRMFTFDLAFDPEQEMNITLAKDQGRIITEALQQKFPTYDIALVDADRAEASSRAWAAKVALLCVTLVLFTLALILSSITLPLIVGLPIPFGLMGIVWALYLHDMPMGIMSLIGLIGTVGVSVNDSLIMVDQIMKRGRKAGQLTREHIVNGAASRLRAILLTTITTLGGVFPMAYGIGGESGFTQPLAFSLGWGLFFSTFLTLFALPAFIEIRRDFGRWGRRLLTHLSPKKARTMEAAQPDPNWPVQTSSNQHGPSLQKKGSQPNDR